MAGFLREYICCNSNHPCTGAADQVALTIDANNDRDDSVAVPLKLAKATQSAAPIMASVSPSNFQGRDTSRQSLDTQSSQSAAPVKAPVHTVNFQGRDTSRQSLDTRSSEGTQSSTPLPSPRELSAKSKDRLQRMVKDFAKEAVEGILVDVINADTGEIKKQKFQMDRYLSFFTLKPKRGSADNPSLQEEFSVADLILVSMGADVVTKAPHLAHVAPSCVCFDTHRRSRFFYFNDHYRRDQFYTLLSVLLRSHQDVE